LREDVIVLKQLKDRLGRRTWETAMNALKRMSVVVCVALMMALAPAAAGQERPGPPRPEVVILSFTATPNSIHPGQSVTLEWTVVNAGRIRLDPGIGIVGERDSRTVKPGETTTYTLTALGYRGVGIDKRSVKVKVEGTAPEHDELDVTLSEQGVIPANIPKAVPKQPLRVPVSPL
jgi:hypothetical protein